MVPVPPTSPVQIVPWLAAPFSPLLWVALGLTLALTLALLLPFRRSGERCPLSPRWLAVGTVVVVGLLSALSLGAQLANPVTAIVAPVFIFMSTAVAYAAWHAGHDSRAVARVCAAALALASALSIACVLGCYELLWLPIKARDPRLDLELGAGAGEAVALLLPALGATALPLLLLPASHPRTASVRRAIVTFAGFLTLLLSTAALVGIAVLTRVLPADVALADRYDQTNAALTMPLLIGSLCAVACGIASLSTHRWLRLTAGMAAVACSLGLAVNALGLPSPSVVGLNGWQIATCLAIGFVVGAVASTRSPRAWPLRGLLPVAAAAVCLIAAAVVARGPAEPSANAHSLIAAQMIAILGLFAASTVVRCPASSTVGSAPQPQPLPQPVAGAVVATCLAIGMALACAVCVRSGLTYQARASSLAFAYESNRQVDPEMRTMLQNSPHGIHTGGPRWAWVMPQAIWWSRDGAWRDAAVIADYTQPVAGDDVPVGYLYGAVVTGANRKRSGVPFTDAQYVALIQPVPIGQTSRILHTVTARFLTPGQFLSWARIEFTNPRAIGGGLVGCALAWWLTRQGRTLAIAAATAAASIAAVGLLAGVAGVLVMVVTLAVLVPLAAAKRDDSWGIAALLTAAMGSAVLLMPAVIPLAEVL